MRTVAALLLMAVGCAPPAPGNGAAEPDAAERLFVVRLSGPDTSIVERVLRRDPIGAHSVTRESLAVWCADVCLLDGEGLDRPGQDYRSALARGDTLFEREASAIHIGRHEEDADVRSRRLNESLRRAYRRAGVYRILRETLEAERDRPGSCVGRCISGSLDSPFRDGEAPPWRKVVGICPSNRRTLTGSIVLHPAEPTVPESYRRAASLLARNERFQACLRRAIRRVPGLEEALVALYPGSPRPDIEKMRQAVWMVWETSGVDTIINEAAAESPDARRIEALIDACLEAEDGPPTGVMSS
jgi:hypothetical protein